MIRDRRHWGLLLGGVRLSDGVDDSFRESFLRCEMLALVQGFERLLLRELGVCAKNAGHSLFEPFKVNVCALL